MPLQNKARKQVGRERHMSTEKETGRVEAFSDGVFAVAITLLALDIHVPRLDALPHGGLGPALLALWPSLLAYVTSFATILIMWLNHDRLFEQIHRKDHLLLIYNGLLLMVITLFPFPTALLAEYLAHGAASAKIAAAVYSAFSIVMAVCFNLLWRHAATGGRLLADDHDRHKARGITEQYRLGPLIYFVAFGLAFVSAPASVLVSFLLALFFALPPRAPQQPAQLPQNCGASPVRHQPTITVGDTESNDPDNPEAPRETPGHPNGPLA